MLIAQELCPDGEWVFQLMAYQEWKNGKEVQLFNANVTNGDDNVTSISENPGAAVAQLIYYLLNGSVFPLTGNGGMKMFPGDNGWIYSPTPPVNEGMNDTRTTDTQHTARKENEK